MTTYTLNTARTAAVSTAVFWQPITPATPRGVKVLCISRHSGIAQVCTIHTRETFFDYWAPLPRWPVEGEL